MPSRRFYTDEQKRVRPITARKPGSALLPGGLAKRVKQAQKTRMEEVPRPERMLWVEVDIADLPEQLVNRIVYSTTKFTRFYVATSGGYTYYNIEDPSLLGSKEEGRFTRTFRIKGERNIPVKRFPWEKEDMTKAQKMVEEAINRASKDELESEIIPELQNALRSRASQDMATVRLLDYARRKLKED